MEKCVCTFASFQRPCYSELRELQTGPACPASAHACGNGHTTIDTDCSSFVNTFQNLISGTPPGADFQVTCWLGCLLHAGPDRLSRRAKGVLSLDQFQQLQPSDCQTQFSRHFRRSLGKVPKILEVLAKTGEWKVEEGCRKDLRFSLVPGCEADGLPLELEVATAGFDYKSAKRLPKIRDLYDKKPKLVQSDVAFLASGVALRFELAPDQRRMDLTGRFASASFRDKMLRLRGKQPATYRLVRTSEPKQVYSDGHLKIVWSEADDFFNDLSVPYEALHLVSPSLNESLKAGDVSKASSEFEQLVETAKKLERLMHAEASMGRR
ncbi:unnamed protein product [Effrenium voratum]|nr:unnamed protein product [Effrenium voratum]